MSDILARMPVTQLKGVGAKVTERLAKLGIETLQDLLFHLPFRYQDRTHIYPIASLRMGYYAVVEGEIKTAQVKFGKSRSLVCQLQDHSGRIELRFFHFNAAQQNMLAVGAHVRCFGEVKSAAHSLQMIHPEFQAVQPGSVLQVEAHLTPIYPSTEGLRQATLRKLIEQALQHLQRGVVEELLPQGAQQSHLSLADALHYLHYPPPDVSLEQLQQGQHPAQQRLVLEELVAHQMSVLKLRTDAAQLSAAHIQPDSQMRDALLQALPFEPTQAQCRVVQAIEQDLASGVPMMRLVQGDVGSGKTLVAALAALDVIQAGYQVAIMAPTEILAEQHLQSFTDWLQPLGIQVAALLGKQGAAAKRRLVTALQQGDIQLVVGTHALFQQQVAFARLGLVVVDEQHRFGVHQRLMLWEKGRSADNQVPHQLIMTATPIPRTLAMSVYADLDTSVIDELPPGRTPVETVVIADTRREQVIARVAAACQQGRQAYWVCTLIEESEELQCQAAEATADYLRQQLPALRIGLVHGRMKGADKQAQMDLFKQHQLDLLVATTVIEVGVNVPNASLMIIENPERLGLAQLHQLRGRVGRGAVASHCVLMYHHPLSAHGKARLAVLRDSNDGFVIAEQDLQLRGPGEVLGTRQTGVASFKVADLMRDKHLLPQANALALQLLQQPDQAQKLVQRWLRGNERYGQV